MTIKTIQKVIKIGSSSGVTIPAKDMKHAGVKAGDEVEVTIRKTAPDTSTTDNDVVLAAKNILSRYKEDFDNLAKR